MKKLSEVSEVIFYNSAEKFVQFVRSVGDLFVFIYDGVRLLFTAPSRFGEFLKHMDFIGNKSLGIISLTALFTGLALSLQVYLGFKLVNATNLVGPIVALAITRELGPVLTGLIVAARAGGAMAARLGTMRVNEQIDAIDVMGINPKQYLVSPRIAAAIVSMPLLTAVFDFVAMLGSYFLVVHLVHLDEAVFWQKIRDAIQIKHILEGLVKSAFFGLIFSAICTYRGFYTKGGAKGVGEATNRGVVVSMVMIIVLDYFLTSLIRFYYLATGSSL